MSDSATGRRRVVRIGNTGVGRSWTLQIPSGRYYWSAQAIDYNYAGSPFAQEQSIDVPPGAPLVHIADITRPVLGDVQFQGVVHPNGGETIAYFEYGNDSFDHSTEPVVLPSNGGYTNLFAGATNLPLGLEWHVRLVASNAFGVQRSAEKLFVTGNEGPTVALSISPAQVSIAPMRQAEIPFVIGDRETPPDSLRLSVLSSDWNLVPLENIVLSGTGTNRSLRVTAGTNTGTVSITIVVTDSIDAEARVGLTIKIERFSQLRLSSSALRAADVNRDGLLDILTAYGSSRFQTNLGQMQFRTGGFMANTYSSAGIFSDWDRDGILDLAVCSAFTTATTFTSGLYFGADNGLVAPTPVIALPFRSRAAFESEDFDGDGAPDLLAVGATNSGQLLRAGPLLFCGSANSIGFQVKRIGLHIFDYPALAAGDIDGDGRIDFICTGMASNTVAPAMYLYHNDGGGNFTEIRMSLPGLTGGGLALADIDGDGDLDLAMSGSATTSLTSGATAAIYKNNGDGTFVLFQTLTAPLHHASVQWGDFDGDGDYDLLLNGYQNGGAPPLLRIIVNENGNFNTLTGLAPVFAGVGASQVAGSAEWADLDGDGDLDILVGGNDGAAIYRNNLNPTNLQPSAPTGLRARQYGERIVLEWDAPAGAAMPGITYNVRLGSISKKDNYVPCMADPVSGKRWVTRRGNAEHRNTMTVSGLPPGRYFWSVQAIGPSYVGSEFAAESSVFIIGPENLRMEARNFSASGVPIIRFHAPAGGQLTIEASQNLTDWEIFRVLQVTAGPNDIQVNPPNDQKTLFVRAFLKL